VRSTAISGATDTCGFAALEIYLALQQGPCGWIKRALFKKISQ
jgi:hypothetical protein